MGPLWNNNHAQRAGRQWINDNPGWQWHGAWTTTIPGKMSVIIVSRTLPLSLDQRLKLHQDSDVNDHGSEEVEIDHIEEEEQKDIIQERPNQRSFGILQNNVLRIKATHGAMEIVLKKCQDMGVQFQDDKFAHDASSLVHNAFD